MSETTKRILIASAIIGLIACVCLVVFGITAGGLSFLTISRNEIRETQPEAVQVITDTPEVTAPTEEADSPEVEATDAPDETPTVTTEAAPTQESQQALLPAEVAEQMDEIEGQVSNLRGLEATTPLSRTLITTTELRSHLEADFEEDYSPEEAREDVLELAAFGLVPPDFDFYNFYLDLQTEQIAGYYDPEIQTMYVVQGEGFNGLERSTYAHEYTHALQDQTWDLDEGLGYNDEECEEDSERCAGIQALIEGDASFSELGWLTNDATDDDIRDIQEFYATYESPMFDSAPEFLKEDLGFPYQAGMEFVQFLFGEGGWEAIDAAYDNPPFSTEQILHPELYPDESPQDVVLPELLPALGESWRELENDTIGEWYTYLILSKGDDADARLEETQARIAADGWGGDAYAVFINDTTDQTSLVVHYQWDTTRDADQFAAAFREWSTNRFGNPGSSGNVSTWQGDPGYTLLSDGEQESIWILAPDEASAQALLAAFE